MMMWYYCGDFLALKLVITKTSLNLRCKNKYQNVVINHESDFTQQGWMWGISVQQWHESIQWQEYQGWTWW